MAGGGFANSMLLATAAAVVTFIPSGLIATNESGRKRTILMGIVLLFASFTVASWFYVIQSVYQCAPGNYRHGMGFDQREFLSYGLSRWLRVPMWASLLGTTILFHGRAIITPVLSELFLEYVGYRTAVSLPLPFFSAAAFITYEFGSARDQPSYSAS